MNDQYLITAGLFAYGFGTFGGHALHYAERAWRRWRNRGDTARLAAMTPEEYSREISLRYG